MLCLRKCNNGGFAMRGAMIGGIEYEVIRI